MEAWKQRETYIIFMKHCAAESNDKSLNHKRSKAKKLFGNERNKKKKTKRNLWKTRSEMKVGK